ncbi:hypothetical protein TNCV_1004811 [Trichonephila clavipes]|nr:hypothetical protein TNCV_1004811 [Trichonephila clavipes]
MKKNRNQLHVHPSLYKEAQISRSHHGTYCSDWRITNSEKLKSGKGPLTPADLLKFVKRFEETGQLEDRARAGRPCLKEARVPCIAVEMEAIASEAASGINRLVKLPDDWAYHHHLSAIFFVESSSCTHTNCNRAMNFCQQIPHRGKHLRSGPSLKWNRTFLASW